MKSQPFAEKITVHQIFQDERITQGLARLLFMLSYGQIALITGHTGSGKSTLIKLLLNNLPQNQYWPVYVHFTHVRASSLFKLIVKALGEVPKLTKEQVFLQIMDKTQSNNMTVVIIIDEAHLLDTKSIVDLRLLVSSALDEKPPLKLILSGQDDLIHKLKRSDFTDFAHRVSVCCQMKPLTKAQTVAYMDFQMKYAGASERVFDTEVKETIYEYSNGIARQINNIATGCLINGAIQNVQKINMEILNQTMNEFRLF
jgi:general secretion pathway protein A